MSDRTRCVDVDAERWTSTTRVSGTRGPTIVQGQVVVRLVLDSRRRVIDHKDI
jgi:hypothetical protein